MTATEAKEYIEDIVVTTFQRYPPDSPTEANITVKVTLTNGREADFKTKVPYSEVDDPTVEENFIGPAKEDIQPEITNWIEQVGTRSAVEGSSVVEEW